MKYWYSAFLLLVVTSFAHAEDKIINFSVQENIGLKEVPIIHVEVEISKTRDLYVALQDLDNGWKQITSKMKRLRKSGKYSLQLKVEDLKPGNYRWNAYIAPRGKNWNEKIGEQLSQNMRVVDADKYVEAIKFSNNDQIQKVVWPKVIADNSEYILNVAYAITQPRDLYIKLYNKVGWVELGSIKVPVAKPGEIKFPIADMIKVYGKGEFAWVANLSETGETEILGKKQGRVFTIE
ncbi:hypothetical protein [Catenovulum maritimum]|uniref:Uncharacterized protein n=1 Tax=Catenovulum maritimum TaxID=1513271 RepID=A0A0J8GWE5_9ALTE|nr:hypothetical protein [Catenovulum maritimum]KMT67077.1 hypothetical protein XM47_00335 [Catenovulum maritimum]